MDGGATKAIAFLGGVERGSGHSERETDRPTDGGTERNPNSVRNRTEKLSYTQTNRS